MARNGFPVSTFSSKAAARGLRSFANDDAPEVGLGMLLRNADNAFNRVLRHKLAAHRVSFSEFQHLRQLWDEEGLTQVELSRRIGIERASSTAVIVSLLRKKLIRRSADPSDKRKVLVYPTARGAALRDRLWPCAIDTNTIAYAGLNQEDRRTLFRLLHRVTANLNTVLDE
jgi:MarR family transcriptional regulator, organic hydroperoxide resistance regulator